MILALRQRHRRIFAVLGIVLPLAYAAGVAARKPVPEASSFPAPLAGSSPDFTTVVWTRADLFAKAPVQVRLRRGHGNALVAVELLAPPGFVRPDLMVYWLAAGATAIDTVPDNAVLLGAFRSPALALPAAASAQSGSLILYSLANNEIVDVSRPLSL